jgi:type IV secretion system protein VirB8
VPYTLLVDRETGYVQALKPFEGETIAADSALTRSFLVQYVIARESFDVDSLQEGLPQGRAVVGRRGARALSRADAAEQSAEPAGEPSAARDDRRADSQRLVAFGEHGVVRFSTVRTDPGARAHVAQHWAAVITYRYSNAEMSAGRSPDQPARLPGAR